MEYAANAFWLQSPGCGEIHPATVRAPGPGEVLVRTRYSGVSRGTETLVFRGGVPASQYGLMRAPFQEGDFPGPVKYGYLNVGAVEHGPPGLLGRTVFCLYPHQTRYVVPAGAVTLVPDAVPPARAVLAGTVETAVNALWDAAPLVGDRIAVVGGGHGRLLCRRGARRVSRCEGAAGRRRPGARRGGRGARGRLRARPGEADGECDLVRARQRHRRRARPVPWNCSRTDGVVIELSWYGDRQREPCRWASSSTPAG